MKKIPDSLHYHWSAPAISVTFVWACLLRLDRASSIRVVVWPHMIYVQRPRAKTVCDPTRHGRLVDVKGPPKAPRQYSFKPAMVSPPQDEPGCLAGQRFLWKILRMSAAPAFTLELRHAIEQTTVGQVFGRSRVNRMEVGVKADVVFL